MSWEIFLLHIVFYSKIASEKSKFNFNDVVETIIKKLIVRHPHVFDSKKTISKQEVEKTGKKIKLKEGKKKYTFWSTQNFTSINKIRKNSR